MISIIGCGNPVRGDDGVGHHVIQTLNADPELRARTDLQLFDAGTDGMAVMYQARGSDVLILIDACSSGETPGAIFEVPGSEFDDVPPREQNSHAFRWDHALYAGRRIYSEDFPEDVTVYLIEAETLAAGLDLSKTVAEAADKVVARINEKLSSYPVIEQRETMELRNGSFYIKAEHCQRYFPDIECVAAIVEEGGLYLAPLRNSAGGHLLKQRNTQGDCVVQLQAVFRDMGWNEFLTSECRVHWDQNRAALAVELPTELEMNYATAL